MKTINLTRYCSEEQAKRALVLGAPIAKATKWDLFAGRKFFNLDMRLIPTIEQMVGWFELIGIILTVECDYERGDVPEHNRMRYWSKAIDLSLKGDRKVISFQPWICNSLRGAYDTGIDEVLDYLEGQRG